MAASSAEETLVPMDDSPTLGQTREESEEAPRDEEEEEDEEVE